ncbi:PAS domain S-box protein [Cyanobacteria bacterium FACHB-472]|nr:PAS domain S-box protein [Cyanobacteria bacterium FACHB-472]
MQPTQDILLYNLINAASGFIVVKDNQGRWLMANNYTIELFRLSGVDYQGKTSLELAAYTDDKSRAAILACAACDEKVWREGTVSHSEQVIQDGDGEIKVFDIKKTPLFNPDGSRQKLLVNGSDITRAKLAEQASQEREHRLLRQQTALLELASRKYGELQAALREITEVAARTLGVERVSVWFYNQDCSQICCADLYELGNNCHSNGMKLAAADYPNYFAAIKQKRVIAASDAHNDRRTSELGSYLDLGITSMLDAPISGFGVICHEQTGTVREWALDEQNFACAIAQMVVLAIEECDRQRTELALRESEVRYRDIVEDQTELIVRLSPDGKFTLVNEACCRYFGKHRQEMIGDDFMQYILEEDRERVAKHFAALSRENPVAMIEHKVILSNGEIRIHQWSDRAIFDQQGLVEFQSVGRDITERKQTEEALRESEEKYKVLFETFPLGISITDKAGNIIEANKASEKILCISSVEHTNRTYDCQQWKIVRPDGTPMPTNEFASVKALTENRTVENIEMGVVKNNKEITWINVTSTPITLKNYGVAIAYADITERKAMEQALRESEEGLRSLLNSAPLLLWTSDTNGLCNFFNQGWLDFTGRTLEEELGNGWVQNLHPEDRELRLDTYLSAFAARQCFLIEYRLKRADGKYRWVVDKGVPRFRNGGFEGYIGSCFDITERKQVEEFLRASEAKNRALLDALPDLMMRVSKKGKILECKAAKDISMLIVPEALVGKTLWDFLPPEVAQEGMSYIERSLLSGEIQTWECQIIINDSVRECEARIVTCSQGQEEEVLAIIRDITERKQVEEALHRREQEFRALAENAPDIITRFDKQLRHLYVNPAARKASGLSPQVFIGKTNRELGMPDEIVSFWEKAMSDVWERGCEGKIEFEFLTPDGLAHYQSRIVPEFSADGCVESLLCVTRDISDRIAAEEALKKSEQKLSLHVQQTPLAVIEWNINYEIVEWNPSAEAIFGYKKSEIIGSTGEMIVPENAREHVNKICYKLLTGKGGNRSTNENITKDGRAIICDWYNTSLVAPNGEVMGFASLALDITDRVRAEAALRQQTQRERLVAAITQRIRQSLNLEEILNTAVTEVRQLLECDRVFIYRICCGNRGNAIAEAVVPELPSLLGQTFDEDVFPQSCYERYKNGQVRVIDNLENEVEPCLVAFLQRLEVKAELISPLVLESVGSSSNEGIRNCEVGTRIERRNFGVQQFSIPNHQSQIPSKDANISALVTEKPQVNSVSLWGLVIAHQCSSVRIWQPFEVNLLQQLTTQIAIAIQQAQLYQQLEEANYELQRLACLDGLTQVANRRRFDEYLEREWRRLAREKAPLALIMCDIDFFKLYNDNYGHQAGDSCLQLVAAAISQTLKRPADLVARYGGEEFVVILPYTKTQGALKVAQEIRDRIRELQIFHAKSPISPYITLSLGVAVVVPLPEYSPVELIHTADLALYEAKAAGRDRAILKTCH